LGDTVDTHTGLVFGVNEVVSMAKRKDPLLEALQSGRAFTWTTPDGGDLASMRAAVKHGQTLTMSPVVAAHEARVGDIVLVKWHEGHLFHLVQEIADDRFLIANSVGKRNGWVAGSDILGRVADVVEPEPRPPVPLMLEQLATAYRGLIERERPDEADERGLLSVADDMRWYAARIGRDRWAKTPRQDLWSFEQRLWHLTRRARGGSSASAPSLHDCIDRGKACVGRVAEVVMLWEAEG
jgi:hypothetical protein